MSTDTPPYWDDQSDSPANIIPQSTVPRKERRAI